MKKIFFPFVACILVLLSCDKIDNPIPDDFVNTDGIVWDDSSYVESSPTMRKVMIEEFTGHLCTFCPNGSREIERLDSIYGDQLIPMSIHAGSFAAPQNFDASTPPDGILDYTEDFRTTAGEVYYTTFGVNPTPAATVSRLNNASITGLAQWQTDIDAIKNDVPKISIGLSALYNDSSRTFKTVVSTEWLSTETGSYNLQLYLVEDSLENWQLDNSVHIENYMHRHVFRKAINGTWGSQIPSSNIGDIDTQEFSLQLLPNWNKDKCIIIAHVYKSNPDYEIIQAEEIHIVNH